MASNLSPLVNQLSVNLPDEYLDIVTFLPLTNAVFIKCGHCFNEETAKGLMERKMACPLDRKLFTKFYPNYTLRNIVEAALKVQPQPAVSAPIPESKEGPSPVAVAHFEKGKTLFFANHIEQAINAFLAALILYPTYEKAQVFFESALEAQKRNPLLPSSPSSSTPAATSNSLSLVPLHSSELPTQPLEKHTEKDPGKKEIAASIPSSALSREAAGSAPSLPAYVTQALNRAGRGKALIKAVEEENIFAIRYLLSQETLVDAKDGQNRTPLSVACEKKNVAVLLLLIGNGAPVEGEDAKAALLTAIRNDDREIVKTLVKEGVPLMEKQGPRPDKIASHGFTPCVPLEMVSSKGDVELLKLLLSTKDLPSGVKLNAIHSTSHSANYNNFSSKSVGKHAINVALEKGHTEIARLLIQNGVGVDFKPYPERRENIFRNSSEAEEILLAACRKGDIELVRLLLEKGVDLDRVCMGEWNEYDGQFFYTLRHFASSSCDQKLLPFILSFSSNGKPPAPTKTGGKK